MPAIDDAPVGAFHRRLTIYTCGGPFCDGYILGIIAIALVPITDQFGLSSTWTGLIGAAALIGIFVGGIVFSYVTDLIGRQVMYTLDLLVFVIASILQFWVEGVVALFILRLVLGIAIGADYPIATSLLAEFTPRRQRGPMLSTLVAGWWLGYVVAFLIGYALSGAGEDAWRWMLASSALPAALVLMMRWGTPESPRWLMSKGRVEEARAVIHRYIGDDYDVDEFDVASGRTDWRRVFARGYGQRLAFVSLFWLCQVMPAFAIYTFAPELLETLGVSNGNLGAAIMSLFFLVGVVPAIFLVNRVGRRPVLTIPFAVCGLALLVLGIFSGAPSLVIALLFIVFAIFSTGSSVLQWVYPNELFPTDVRATAVGFATAMSRIGAAVGTFLLPIGLDTIGISGSMLVFAAVCGIGLVVSLAWAPETRGPSLSESSAVGVPAPRFATAATATTPTEQGVR